MFQFQLGAIGSPRPITYLCGGGAFQFQLGAIGRKDKGRGRAVEVHVSIPAWCDWEAHMARKGDEKEHVSIPAWCDWEVPIPDYRKWLHRRFNSSLVRLGATSLSCSPSAVSRFNSSLVRLGVSVLISVRTSSYMFQFQLGAIGSNGGVAVVVSPPMFQFQLGAIGSDNTYFGSGYAVKVSIPAWCDWEAIYDR